MKNPLTNLNWKQGIALSALALGTTFHHLYVTWKQSAFADGKTVKILTDGGGTGKYIESSRTDWGAHTTAYRLHFVTSSATTNGLRVDNLKIWKESVALSPEWEYNAGNGRLDALHPIYGPTNGYKPALTSPNGVGYYSVPRW